VKLKLSDGRRIPIEMHKVRIVQKTTLPSIRQRLKAIEEGGHNTFLLRTRDVFIDMLTDSGTNAQSDTQISKMFIADEAYAGSQSFTRFEQSILQVFGKKFVLPVHQGRAAENILGKSYVKEGSVVPTNYHFTTTLAHIMLNGGKVLELYADEAMKVRSFHPFKGNMDISKLEDAIKNAGPENIPFIRMEASTNLLGGQPFSMENLREVRKVADKYGIIIVLDASLVGENAYFIKVREKGYENNSLGSILLEMSNMCDIIYFSGRKVSSSRGGAICTNNTEVFNRLKFLLPVYEGFLTYGGIPIKEIESMAEGLKEKIDENVGNQ